MTCSGQIKGQCTSTGRLHFSSSLCLHSSPILAFSSSLTAVIIFSFALFWKGGASLHLGWPGTDCEIQPDCNIDPVPMRLSPTCCDTYMLPHVTFPVQASVLLIHCEPKSLKKHKEGGLYNELLSLGCRVIPFKKSGKRVTGSFVYKEVCAKVHSCYF